MMSNKYCDTEKFIGKYFFSQNKKNVESSIGNEVTLFFHNFLNTYRVRTYPDAEVIMTGGRSRSINQNSEVKIVMSAKFRVSKLLSKIST